MTDLTFNFENGTDGVRVETTDTPSVGDTAFDSTAENTGTGGSLKYSTSQAAHGSQSLEVSTGGTSTSAYVQWDVSGFGTTQYFRAYVYFTANPGGNRDILQLRDSSTRARLRINSSGQLVLVNGSTAVATSSASIGLNQWVRLEWRWTANTSTGSMEGKFFNTPDGTTATETISATSLNTGSTEATNVRIGIPIAVANFGPTWFDDLGASDTAYLGPVDTGTEYDESFNDDTGVVDSVTDAHGVVATFTDDTGVSDSAAGAASSTYTGFGDGDPGAAYSADTSGYTLATAFKVTEPDLSLTKIRLYLDSGSGTITGGDVATPSNVLSFTVYSANDTGNGAATPALITTIETSSVSVDAWNEVTLPSPLALTQDVIYYASVGMPLGRYSFTAASFNSDVVVGPITFPANGSSQGSSGTVRNGAFSAGGFQPPTSAFNATWYGIDIEVSGEPPSGTNYDESFTDSTGVVDSASAELGLDQDTTDSAGISETLSAAVAFVRLADDPIGVTDAVFTDVTNTAYGAALKKNGFENGTVGVKVDALDAPTPGDTAFDGEAENTGAGGTLKYDDTHAAHGSLSCKVATGASSTSAYVEYDTSSGGLQKFFRFYMWQDANPSSNRDILQSRDSSGRFRVRLTSDGKLALVNGSTVVATTTNAISLSQWVRIEYREQINVSAGQLELKFFNDPDSDTETESILATALSTGSVETTAVRIGLPISAANYGPAWIDDVAYGVEDWIGPAFGDLTLTGAADDSVGLADELLAEVDGSRTDSVGLSDALTWEAEYSRSLTDDTGSTDALDDATGLPGDAGTDNTGVTDAVSTAHAYARTINDTEEVTESLSSQDRATTGPGSGENFYDVPLAVYDDQPGDAVIYTGSGSLGTAMANLAAGKWLVLDFDGDKVENINVALKNNVTIIAAEGRRPWLNGNIRISGGENTRIYGLNVKNDNVGADDHMVKLDGGSPEWAYSIVTLEDNAPGDGCYTLFRPGQSVHDWRVHHCWVHDNPGATGHSNVQDHGFYCSAENATQNGRIDHCLIENNPRGRNIKIGGSGSGSGAIGQIRVDHCTLKNGQGPSNGQTSNGATNTTWEYLLLIDSGASTNLTDGGGSRSGSIYRFCKGDSVVGEDTANFADGGNNTNNVPEATLLDYEAQGLLGWGHLEGFTAGSAGGTDFAETTNEAIRVSDDVSTFLDGPAPATLAGVESFVDVTDSLTTTLTDTVDEQSVDGDSVSVVDELTFDVGILIYEFRPPTIRRHYLLERPHPLLSRMSLDVGLSVLKTGSSYQTVQEPSTEDIAAADEFYIGGHTYEVTQAQKDALVTAGYGSYITTVNL